MKRPATNKLKEIFKNIESKNQIENEEFNKKWQNLHILTKEEREKRVAETPGYTVLGKVEFNDLIVNTLANYNNRNEALDGIQEVIEYVDYKQREIIGKIEIPYIEISSNCCVIVMLIKLKQALNCKNLKQKYILLSDAENLTREIYKRYAMNLPYDQQKSFSEDLRQNILILFST